MNKESEPASSVCFVSSCLVVATPCRCTQIGSSVGPFRKGMLLQMFHFAVADIHNAVLVLKGLKYMVLKLELLGH